MTGEYDFRKRGYQKLHREMDAINAVVWRASFGEFKKDAF
jgi:hypothetical protein